MHRDIEAVLLTEEQIQRRIAELGAQISADYAGKELHLIGVLRGALMFMADLMRHLTVPCSCDFIAIASYGMDTKSSGVVRILKDLDDSIQGKHVLIVEDIVDTGLTLNYILNLIRSRNPASVRVCALLDKPERRIVPVEIHYLGFTIPNRFVVGYGLDYAQKYRNLPYIGVLRPEIYGGV
ncbi:MAG: hypoxanthine phosphoribosyltransferase [Armatimonadetes bacterium]|nr:hypoxanthine phosphoribosyltransferase [Armatimonadota bacterium]MCX7967275.1 hypoxanthine phosphoribosyltransferase [Armatimonadota bacterium]MDW8141917.1 hypoxanthine phosphoribosyltransferase [Armatimonadota bacterium]